LSFVRQHNGKQTFTTNNSSVSPLDPPLGWHGWRRGNTRSPVMGRVITVMGRGFDPRLGYPTLIVGSLFCHKGFSPGSPVFLPPWKINIPKFQFDLRDRLSKDLGVCYLFSWPWLIYQGKLLKLSLNRQGKLGFLKMSKTERINHDLFFTVAIQ
jgi:hypothetical protein